MSIHSLKKWLIGGFECNLSALTVPIIPFIQKFILNTNCITRKLLIELNI